MNSFGNLGGFIGPFVFGALKEQFNDVRPGLLLLAIAAVIGIAIVLTMPAAGENDRAKV